MDNVFLQHLIQGIDATELTTFSRAIPVRTDFLLSQSILPTRVINSVKYSTSQSSITVGAAKYRAFNAPTPFLRATAAKSVREGYLLPLGGKEAIEEFAIILDEIARGANDERLLEALYNNIQNQTLAIHSRLEVAAGDVLADGILTINENGVVQEANYGVPSAHKPTASVLWSNVATARPLTDELAWIQTLADAGLPIPERVVTSRKVLSFMIQNAEYRNTYWGGETAGVTRPSLTPEQFNSVRGQYGLPAITIYDVQVAIADEVTGALSTVRVLPENKFLMFPPNTGQGLGNTLMGLTAEGIAMSAGQNPGIVRSDAAGIISTVQVEDDPVAITTKTGAVGLPVLHTPGEYIAATVLA